MTLALVHTTVGKGPLFIPRENNFKLNKVNKLHQDYGYALLVAARKPPTEPVVTSTKAVLYQYWPPGILQRLENFLCPLASG